MKRVCVFGAGGRTGVLVVNVLLKRGHEVVACLFGSKPEKLQNKKVLVKVGDILDPSFVSGALEDVDAVISVVGHVKGGDPMMQTKGVKNIVETMQSLGIARIMSLTGTGVRAEGDKPSVIDRILNLGVCIADPKRVIDGIEHAKVLRESSLDWTILRVLKLTNRPWQETKYNLTEGGPAELTTPRAKAAHILVDLVENGHFAKKMPIPQK